MPTTRTIGPDAIEDAAAILRAGGTVAVPTETVYGLAADATDAQAVAAIYAAKGRPASNPLIVHVASLDEARGLAILGDAAERLAAAFWLPDGGPLTLVLPLRQPTPLAPAVTAGLPTVAIRIPRGPMRALCRATGKPLAAPSANRSGRLSPTRATHVLTDLGGRVDAVMADDICVVGLESAIVKVTEGRVSLLREGGLAREAIEAVVGPVESPPTGAKEEAPGMAHRHYAPSIPLRLDAHDIRTGEAWLGFGGATPANATPAHAADLSAGGDTDEAARNLFAMLHDLDASGATCIAVAPVPRTGTGAAINDRLRRAAEASAR